MPPQTSLFPIITRWVNHDKDKHIHPTKDDCNRKKSTVSQGLSLKKSKSIQWHSFIGVRIISVVFHCLNVSSRLSMDFFLASSLSSLSAASKTSSLLSLTLNIKKKLVLDSPDNQNQAKKKAHCNKPLKKQKPKLAANEVDWFNSTSTKNECLKHTSNKNLPVTQERQLTFLLNKYQTSDIKRTFANAIGKAGTAARKFFYSLPHRKDKLIRSFLELIYDGKSIMIDNSKDSFQ
jgi:hypothetical protein